MVRALAGTLLLGAAIVSGDPSLAVASWRIGYLAQGAPQVGGDTLGAFRRGMQDLGYVEGRHYTLEVRNAEGRPERLHELAAELVALRVDLIVAGSTPPAIAAMRATRAIPIVMGVVADPVGSGLVRSLARPGGNVTGTAVAYDEVSAKWIELLASVRGRLTRVAVVSNPTNESMPVMLNTLKSSAQTLNVTLTVHDLVAGSSVDRLLEDVRRSRADGLVVLPDALIRTHGRRIAELATEMRLPAIYAAKSYVVELGGLVSYGPDQPDHFRRAATYVERILKHGAKPADLPIERPTRFELVVNLRTARAIGLTIPPAVLARADHVVE